MGAARVRRMFRELLSNALPAPQGCDVKTFAEFKAVLRRMLIACQVSKFTQVIAHRFSSSYSYRLHIYIPYVYINAV
jgi:hypothetical protein